jgi:hypothetical protein
MAMKKATEVKRLNWRGDAWVYRLSEPHEGHRHVVVSAVTLGNFTDPVEQAIVNFASIGGYQTEGEETFIFGSNADGECETMSELPGSFTGGRDHERALANAGYTIVPGEAE